MLTGPEVSCPSCGRRLDSHDCLTGAPGAAPADGDVAICWGCRAPAAFQVTPLGVVVLRPLTPGEERDVMVDARVTAALDAMSTSATPHTATHRARERLRDDPQPTTDEEG